MDIQIMKVYTHQGLCRAIDVYNFPDDFPEITKILAYKFLFQHNHKDKRLAPSHKQLVESIKKYVKNSINKGNDRVLLDLVDVLLEYSKKDGNDLLKYIREHQIRVRESLTYKPPPIFICL
jgi:hypothetical protein